MLTIGEMELQVLYLLFTNDTLKGKTLSPRGRRLLLGPVRHVSLFDGELVVVSGSDFTPGPCCARRTPRGEWMVEGVGAYGGPWKSFTVCCPQEHVTPAELALACNAQLVSYPT
jgi:hypothetical protein